MGLVLGQQDRTVAQLGDLLPQGCQNLVAVGVAPGDQARPPPAGDLTHTSAQGAQAHRGTAKPLVEPTSRPRFGFGQQSTDPLAEPWAAQPRSAPRGSIFKPGNAVLVVAMVQRRTVAGS